jgi:hypothetical protein
VPVRKFRSIEEMSEPVWRTPGDPELYRAMSALSELARRTRPRRFPVGVHKHRSIEEMNRVQEAWATEHARELAKQHAAQKTETGLT